MVCNFNTSWLFLLSLGLLINKRNVFFKKELDKCTLLNVCISFFKWTRTHEYVRDDCQLYRFMIVSWYCKCPSLFAGPV